MNKSKKPQKQEEPAVTEDDKQHSDPFIRWAAKKIRNLNKKLGDIELLQKRQDLKPEQQEKINSKPTILEERKRLEEHAKFYKTAMVEAVREEAQSNPSLSRLANGLIICQLLKSGGSLGSLEFTPDERSIIFGLGRLEGSSTLEQLKVVQLNNINQFLDNKELSTKIEQAFSSEELLKSKVRLVAGEHKEPIAKTHIQKPVNKESPVKETPAKELPVKEEHTQNEESKSVEKKEVTTKQETNDVKESKVESKVQPKVETEPVVAEKSSQKVEEAELTHQPTTISNNETVKEKEPVSTHLVNQEQSKSNQHANPREHKPYSKPYKKPYNQNKNNYRPRDQYREGGYREGGYREGGYRTYKPKYQEKDVDERKSDTSLEDSDDERYKRRKFNNQEINQLENEGFTVMQKRPKAINPAENQNYSRKQHGYKDKANYHYEK